MIDYAIESNHLHDNTKSKLPRHRLSRYNNNTTSAKLLLEEWDGEEEEEEEDQDNLDYQDNQDYDLYTAEQQQQQQQLCFSSPLRSDPSFSLSLSFTGFPALIPLSNSSQIPNSRMTSMLKNAAVSAVVADVGRAYDDLISGGNRNRDISDLSDWSLLVESDWSPVYGSNGMIVILPTETDSEDEDLVIIQSYDNDSKAAHQSDPR